jgi:hypothetical protein
MLRAIFASCRTAKNVTLKSEEFAKQPFHYNSYRTWLAKKTVTFKQPCCKQTQKGHTETALLTTFTCQRSSVKLWTVIVRWRPDRRTRQSVLQKLQWWEPVFVKRSLGIDSEESISPVYVAWRACTTNWVVVPARKTGNWFLGSLKGLQLRAMLRQSWHIAVKLENHSPWKITQIIKPLCSHIL